MQITPEEMVLIYEDEHPGLSLVDWTNEPVGKSDFNDEYFDFEAIIRDNKHLKYYHFEGLVTRRYLEEGDAYDAFHEDIDVKEVKMQPIIDVEWKEIK